MNKATKETMEAVARYKEFSEARDAAEKAEQEKIQKKKVIGTAKPEWLLQTLDVKKKTLSLPETIVYEGKNYKIRKETINGLISLSKMFFPQHTKGLEETLAAYEAKVGRPRPEVGETRKYQISNKGMCAIPIKFIMNEDLEGTGAALVTFHKDWIEIRNELPEKK